LKLFRSVRFNIWLFLVIALASSIGTFIPQGESSKEYINRFGPKLAPFLSKVGLLDVYHSWWFVALLALMAFDVVVCKLRSLPKTTPAQRSSPGHLEGDRLFHSQPLRFRMMVPAGFEKTLEQLANHLRQKKYSVAFYEGNSGSFFQGTRFKWQGWGDFIVHVSILLILFGALVGAIWGFKEFLPVIPGQSKDLQHKPWTLNLDNFQVSYYPGTGQASRYASDVRLYEGNRLLAQKTIIVNRPLDVQGTRFYQASWGMTGMLRSATLRVAGQRLVIPRGERVPIRGTPLSVEARMLYPDFDLDELGQPTTKSLEPNNPAVLVNFYEGNDPLVSMWLFRNRPELCLRVSPQGEVSPAAHPPFRLVDFQPVLFSGFQVSYDPGAKIFWWGCFILLTGLILRFYFHQRRLICVVRSSEGASEVCIGGWSSRGAEDFKGEFQALVSSCQRLLSGRVLKEKEFPRPPQGGEGQGEGDKNKIEPLTIPLTSILSPNRGEE